MVDDEESARDVLGNLLARYCPGVEILGKYGDLTTAVPGINDLKPDLVFLDIEMPHYAGYEIVNLIGEVNFEIIFVTAYDHYALRAFEISAADYLLKPIDIDRLKDAVERVANRVHLKQRVVNLDLLSQTLKTNEVKKLVITDKGNQYIVALGEVIAFEAQESYSYIHTTERRYTVSKNLKHFENLLAEHPVFIRVHKSWIISRDHIVNYSRSDFRINMRNGIVARLSKYKKAEFELLVRSE